MKKWSSIVQYSCTSIWDLQYTFSVPGINPKGLTFEKEVMTGLEINFLTHMQNLANVSKIFSLK